QKKEVAHLREIFMGTEPASFEPSTGLRHPLPTDAGRGQGPAFSRGHAGEGDRRTDEGAFFNEKLNQYQREAVLKALRAKDVSIIHGPPGTGKTTVLVEIVRHAVAAGQRVLASAPSNIAVDNMLEKMLDAGLKAVRMG